MSVKQSLIIRENVPLRDFTTFRVGGPARFFCEVTTEDQLIEALVFAQNTTNSLFFILGGGSNILISDKGFEGLVILMNIRGNIEGFDDLKKQSDQFSIQKSIQVKVGAGENWDDFVARCVSHGLTSVAGGLENLSGIPGTVGAAPVQNIGAYGVEVAEMIESVRVYDTDEKAWKTIKGKEECEFAYRDSIFKHTKNINGTPRYVITAVTFLLKKFIPDGSIGAGVGLRLDYKDIKEYFSGKNISNVTPADVRVAVLSIRSRKLPDVRVVGTAGSFFKNPIISKSHYDELKKKYSDMPSFSAGNDLVKIPLAWILDHVCGYKGMTKGAVGTYKNQALVIVNNGDASSEDIKNFANEARRVVKEKTNIDIEPEVQYI